MRGCAEELGVANYPSLLRESDDKFYVIGRKI